MPEPDYEILADAIYRQEGGDKSRHPYGVMSIKPKDKADARQIAINTAKKNYGRWQAAGEPGAYLDFLASRYVPASADPEGNARWRKNVPAIYAQLTSKKPAPAPAAPVAPTIPPLLMQPLPPIQYPVFPQYPLLKQ